MKNSSKFPPYYVCEINKKTELEILSCGFQIAYITITYFLLSVYEDIAKRLDSSREHEAEPIAESTTLYYRSLFSA